MPLEVLNDYNGILEEYRMYYYDNIIDYLNSTILNVSYPGMSVEIVKQTQLRSKERAFKPSTHPQDLVSSHEFTVTFRSVDNDMNYFLCLDIFNKHYLDNDNLFIQPFVLTSLDIFRNAVYQIRFYELIAVSLSENLFDYSIQKINPKEFTMTFRFNYFENEFLFNKRKIIDKGSSLGGNPLILHS